MITQWEGIYFLLIGKKSQTKKKQQTKSQNNSKQTNKKPRNNINLDLILILNQKKNYWAEFPNRHSVSETTVNIDQFIIWKGQVVLFYFAIALFSQFLAPLSSTYSL